MKQLDVMTIRAISGTLFSMYWDGFTRESDAVRDLADRAEVNLEPAQLNAIYEAPSPIYVIVNALNGTDDLRRLLLRVVSPKEHAGDRGAINKVVHELNQALWPESLKIEFNGVEPRLSEITEPSMIPRIQTVRRKRTVAEPTANQASTSDEVFIIHGRDIGTKDTVARLIERLGIKPVVLQDLPNRGRTIIEKFEDYSRVGFAIAIFTPDDQGSLVDEPSNPRTRQNVIFELGYFVGKLGRDRACAPIKGEVEIPSDYSGVVYIPLDDDEGWEMKLVRELQHAGYKVDANVLTLR